ncbi:MAG: DUF5067 domain-containing protein [Clostridia bacterium]|nr:DUF5067 domain-containing protein [Clostridia bacterium]
MKKSLSAILSIIIVLVFALFAIASSSSDGEKTTQSAGEAQTAETDSNVGDYSVEIKDARITETYDGKAAVVITYGFTNNAENAVSFSTAFEATPYQGGVGLNEAFMLRDGDPYTSDNQYKEIKTGATIDVDIAYELNDTETDIEVEVEEFLGWTDDKVTKTFTIK